MIVLAALLAFPSLVHYLLPVDSMAPGAVIVCILIVLLGRHRVVGFDAGLGSNVSVLCAIGLFVPLHFVFAALFQPVDWVRFAASFVVLVLVFFAAARAGSAVYAHCDAARSPERLLLYALTVAAFVGAAGIAPPGSAYFFKPIFPFTEPSLFGLSYLPLLAAVCVTASGWTRLAFLATGLIVALSVQNLTIIVGLLLIVLVCEPILGAAVLAAIGAVVLGSAGLDLSYYSDRLDLSIDNQNLSALVYLQGWQMVAEAWRTSHGWGLGFQQLGIAELHSEASNVIYDILGASSNLKDGGFVFAKLVSEFGVFGVGLLAAHLILAIRYTVQLRRVAKGRLVLPQGTVLAMSVVMMYVVEVYVRSAGYFVGTGVLVLAAVLYLRSRRGRDGLFVPIRQPRLQRRLSGQRRRAGAGKPPGEVVDVGFGLPLGAPR